MSIDIGKSIFMTDHSPIDKLITNIRTIMELYVEARKSRWQKNKHVKDNFRDCELNVREYLSSVDSQYYIKASYGIVNAATIPWIIISNPSVTTSAQHGIYIVFLFSEDMQSVYLCIAQGVTDKIKEKGRRQALAYLLQENQKMRDFIRTIDAHVINTDEQSIHTQVQLGTSTKAEEYEHSVIIYKKYLKNAVTSDSFALSNSQLITDLQRYLHIYERLVLHMKQSDNTPTHTRGLSELVARFRSDLSQTTYIYDQVLIERMFASLLAKRFVILTGLSGSGKTQLALKIAEWFSPNIEDGLSNPYYQLVAVGADWHDRTSMLGYFNTLSKTYTTTTTLQLILHAIDHQAEPHFLILDEMNLSHVERYFADFLSAIESGQGINLHSEPDINDVPQHIPQLPKNLFVIGTVNIDETTHLFSPKVLDRANVIEFRMNIDSVTMYMSHSTRIISFPTQELPTRRVAESATSYEVSVDMFEFKGQGNLQGFDTSFITAQSLPPEISNTSEFTDFIIKWFTLLQEYNAEFGYRTIKEAKLFLAYYQDISADTPLNNIFDCIIYQKILPKLNGSRTKLSNLLEKISKECDATQHPMSAAKVQRMISQLQDQGFTSFAEA